MGLEGLRVNLVLDGNDTQQSWLTAAMKVYTKRKGGCAEYKG